MIVSAALALLSGLSACGAPEPEEMLVDPPVGSKVFGLVTSARIGVDPGTGTCQHRTATWPDLFAAGSRVGAAYLVGQCSDVAAGGLNVSLSTNGGASFTQRALPLGGYARADQPAITYAARSGAWLVLWIASGTDGHAAVLSSRSSDNGVTWSTPTVLPGSNTDLPHLPAVACDNTPSSPYYGRCYASYTFQINNYFVLATSTDGGASWGGPRSPTPNANNGWGGRPVVQPGGRVIVPYYDQTFGIDYIAAARSTDGGGTWQSPTTGFVSANQNVPGLGLRVLPSASTDASGKVYMAWHDCQLRLSCRANDLLFASSSDGATWSAAKRVPLPQSASGKTRSYFVPGLGVDPTTSGASTKLGVSYYFYADNACTASSCQLYTGFVSSANAGSTWGTPVTLSGPAPLSWLAPAIGGFFLGERGATAYSGGVARPVYSAGAAPTGGLLDQAIYSASGL